MKLEVIMKVAVLILLILSNILIYKNSHALEFIEITGGEKENEISTIEVHENQLYVGGKNIIAVLDITDPARPKQISFTNDYQNIKGLKVDEINIYAISASELFVIKKDDIGQSTAECRTLKITDIRNLFITKDTIYIAYKNGLKILNKNSLEDLGSLDKINIHDVLVKEEYAYLLDGDYGLRVADVSQPEAIRKVWVEQSHPFEDSMEGRSGLAIWGKHLISSSETSLDVFSIDEPGKPLLGMEFNGRACRGVGLTDKNALVFDGMFGNMGYFDNKMYSMDLLKITKYKNLPKNNPESYKRIEGFPAYPIFEIACDLATKDEYAYIVDGSKRLWIIDTAKKATSYFNMVDMVIKKQCAYLLDGTMGLMILDIANPEKPIKIATLKSIGEYKKFMIKKDYAYIVGKKLQVVDVKQPELPSLKGSIDLKACACDISMKNQYAYLTCGTEGVMIVNVSNPKDPVVENEIKTERRADVTGIVGDILYVECAGGDIDKYDISQPKNPKLVKKLEDKTLVDGFKTYGGRLWVARGDWPRVLDKEDKFKELEIAHMNIHSWLADISFLGENILFLDGHYGLKIITKENDEENISQCKIPGRTYNVIASGDYAYVTSQPFGFWVVDVHNLQTPKIVGSYFPD